jgi:hypothetical protein
MYSDSILCILLYRMSAVEERFEQVVRREDKDISQMRKIVRKNGKYQQEIKVCARLGIINTPSCLRLDCLSDKTFL